jgi:hypothetical protein
MLDSRFLILGGLAAVAALSLGWSAIADDGEGDRADGERWSIPVPPPPDGGDRRFPFGELRGEVHAAIEDGERPRALPPPPPGGPLHFDRGEMTWGELHLQRDGEEVVVRIDHGEISSVSDEAITLARNDGTEVEIPVDEETVVWGGPFRGEQSHEDLEEGEEVHVSREAGGAAEIIGVLPEIPFVRPDREGD